ncbi:GIY-YIG nuclease family protein [Granulicella sp. S190]|uniref:GIY-YIG nuclease family protein n=1 Tax=Granulicella sp. S190 TaxID=1747226 RepID=UPI0020B11909|nr:GIY-YIG nuclease family protein [Granulicella sp. S190]
MDGRGCQLENVADRTADACNLGGFLEKQAYVYIMASSFKKLYIWVTTQIEIRIAQHKRASSPNSHTARYKIDRLVYLERFTSISAAIVREKQLKGWLRVRKLELIVSTNPDWSDLSADWEKPLEAFSEDTHRKALESILMGKQESGVI